MSDGRRPKWGRAAAEQRSVEVRIVEVTCRVVVAVMYTVFKVATGGAW